MSLLVQVMLYYTLYTIEIHPFRYCFNYEWVSSKLPIDWCMNMESCMQFCNQATPLDDFVIPLLLLSFRICKRFTWARFIYTRKDKENQWLKVCMHLLKNPALIWSYQLRAMTYIFLNKIASFIMQEREKTIWNWTWEVDFNFLRSF